MNKIFYALSVIGSILICVFAFILPKNPYQILPAITIMGIDKPLWLSIIIVGLFFYNGLLYEIYEILNKKFDRC